MVVEVGRVGWQDGLTGRRSRMVVEVRRVGGLGYKPAGGEDSGEDGKEDEWGDNTEGSLGDNSSASGAPTTEDDEYLIGGADGMSGATEDSGGWRWATRCRRRHGGRKVSAQRKGGQVSRQEIETAL